MKLQRAAVVYRLEIVSFFVGAIVLTFELTASRISAPYIGTTIYVWTSIIGAVLAGLAGGYAVGGFLADKRHRASDIVLLLTAGAVLLLVVDLFKDPILGFVSGQAWPLQLQSFLTSVILFVPPTFVLGTIPPYLARLSLSNLSSSGRHIGRINSAGTVGSLIGTFLTGYVVFGYIGTRSILGLLAVALILVSFFMQLSGLWIVRGIVMLASAFLVVYTPNVHIYNLAVIKDIDTRYNNYVIGDTTFNGQPIRVLQPEIFDWESGVYLNGNRELVFPYTQDFAAVAARYPSDHHILMIGGGTFTVPEYLADQNPANKVDVVEIDGQLIAVSRDYFNFREPSNMHIIQADGRQFLNQNSSRYNLIYLDAFSGGVPPFQLLTEQATERVRDALAPNGIVSVNIVAPIQGPGSALAESVLSTYQHVFSHVSVYEAQPGTTPQERQNLLLLASQSPLPTTSNPGTDADQIFRQVLSQPVSFADQGIVLTDNYAPVERLLAAYY